MRIQGQIFIVVNFLVVVTVLTMHVEKHANMLQSLFQITVLLN